MELARANPGVRAAFLVIVSGPVLAVTALSLRARLRDPATRRARALTAMSAGAILVAVLVLGLVSERDWLEGVPLLSVIAVVSFHTLLLPLGVFKIEAYLTLSKLVTAVTPLVLIAIGYLLGWGASGYGFMLAAVALVGVLGGLGFLRRRRTSVAASP